MSTNTFGGGLKTARRVHRRRAGNVLMAIMAREGKIRVTNLLFIFWDLFYPLGYLLVFGVGINASLGFTTGDANVSYNEFFLAGVLAMASFGISSNTAWSFFMDRDNGIFYEMLTYPMSRAQYLLGKVLFNVFIAVLQTAITIVLAAAFLSVPLRVAWWPLVALAMIVGTSGWFFFYAIFALRIRRNDAFNTVTSIFYFVFLFASSMFYPVEPLPVAFQVAAYANPITWQVDVLRYLTIGAGDSATIALEAAAFVAFTLVTFAVANHALRNQE